MRIFIASDHAGLALKSQLAQALTEWGHQVDDLGTHDESSTDYPDYAHQLAQRVVAENATTRNVLGVLVCGSGIGMSIAANRHAGVRAALCHDVFSAKASRQHNDANVLCMGQRVVGKGVALEVLRGFVEASFEGGRHQRRVDKIEVG